MYAALERLRTTNAMGWGAFYGLATRRAGLTRWQRGDIKSLIEVPAIIADIDEPLEVALQRVHAFSITPSCIVSSGHGAHLYWLLGQPTTDMQTVNAIHRGLARVLKGDYLTAATALRLPGSTNTKYARVVPCEVIQSDWSCRYELKDFAIYRWLPETRKNRKDGTRECSHQDTTLCDRRLIQVVANRLIGQGFKWRDTWLNGPCPNVHQHKHADLRPSFGFNTATGYGYCFVCGSMLLKNLCRVFNIGESHEE